MTLCPVYNEEKRGGVRSNEGHGESEGERVGVQRSK